MKKLLVLSGAFLLVLSIAGPGFTIPSQWSGNGHYYDIIPFDIGRILNPFDDRYSWKEAFAAASGSTHEGLTGHLATFTSANEWEFVAGLSKFKGNLWLGGIQAANAASPTDGWSWVTLEAWTFNDAWDENEPNDWWSPAEDGQENFLETTADYSWSRSAGLTRTDEGWNDDAGWKNQGYIVEYGGTSSSSPVPEPATMLLFGVGLIGLAGFGRKKLKSSL